MNIGRTVFAQLMDHVPSYGFKCVTRYRGDDHLRAFLAGTTSGDGVRSVDWYRESLRDIEACLRSMTSKLYHIGLRGNWRARHWRCQRVARSASTRTAQVLSASHGLCTIRSVDLAEPVRAGLHHHRPLPLAVSVGTIPPTQGCRQTAYAAGPAWQDPHVSPRHGRLHDVNISTRSFRAGAFYVTGSRLQSTSSDSLSSHSACIFRRADERERLAPTPLFSSSRQNQRLAIRSYRETGNRPGHTPIRYGALRTSMQKQTSGEVAGQFRATRTHYRSNLQVPLAGGTVLQMDQEHLRIKAFYGVQNAVTHIWIRRF